MFYGIHSHTSSCLALSDEHSWDDPDEWCDCGALPWPTVEADPSPTNDDKPPHGPIFGWMK